MPVSAEQRPEYFELASRILGVGVVHGPSTKCLTLLDGERLPVAVVIYDRISRVDCDCHFVTTGVRRWFHQGFAQWVAHVAFVQYGLRRVTAPISASNRPALMLARMVGFREEGRRRQACLDGSDEIVFGMLREECRYLSQGESYGNGWRRFGAES